MKTNYKGIELNMSKEMASRILKSSKLNNYTERKTINALKREEKKISVEKMNGNIKSITINIEWKKSRTWGWCPTASSIIEYEDGSHSYTEEFKASGWGYDKESTVVASLLNDRLKYKLWKYQDSHTQEELDNEYRKSIPYGLRFNKAFSPRFEGGVGMSCYYSIIEFLGGKLNHTSSGKTFDVYTITF